MEVRKREIIEIPVVARMTPALLDGQRMTATLMFH